MKERIAEASPGPWARTTGLVYLLCFLTAVSAEAFVGQVRHVTYDAVNLIAYAFYIAVTLLCYYMFSRWTGATLFSRRSSASRDAPISSWPL